MDLACAHRVKLFHWLIIAGLGLCAVITLFCFDPSQYSFYPRCVFHQTTGLLCPGCGGLRSLHQLLHGHIVAAFNFNPFLICLLPILFVYCAFGVATVIRNERRPFVLSPRWLWALFACLFVFGVWRNLPVNF
jgi:Protein of unknown function (DUF2752).